MLYHYAVSSLFIFILTLFLAFFIYFKNKKSIINRRYALYSLVMALWSFSYFRMITSSSHPEGLFWAKALNIPAIFIPVFFLHFGMVLLKISQEKKKIIVGSYAVAFMLLSVCFSPLFVKDVVPKFSFNYFIVPGPLYHAFTTFFFVSVVYTLYKLYRGFKSVQGLRKNQIKYVFLAYLIGYAGGAMVFLPLFDIPTPKFGLYPISICMLIVGYAVVKYSLMDVRVAVTRISIFLTIYAFILGIPVYLGFLTQSWVISTSVAVIFATAGPIVYRAINKKAEEMILAEQRRYQKLLLKSARGMIKEFRLPKLMKWIVYVLRRTVGIQYTALFLGDKDRKIFRLKAKEDNGQIPDALEFSYEHPFVSYMRERHAPFFYEEMPTAIRKSLSIPFDVNVIIPSFVEKNQLGFLLLGEKVNRDAYSEDDMNVFKILAHQAGLAIENAQLYTELQKEALELKKTVVKLNDTQNQLIQSEKMAAMGRLASGIAHELRNPLAIILQGMGVIKSSELRKDDHTVMAVEKIENSVKRADNIINDLLKFARSSKLALTDIGVCALLEETLVLLKNRIYHSGIKIVKNFPAKEIEASVDRNMISQVFFNLVNNAIDAVAEGGTITLGVEEDGSFVKISIADTGKGMSKKEISNIFDPFFTTKEPGKGSGLGLSIVKMILDRHKAEISVDSAEGRGTIFIVKLLRKKKG